MIFMKLKLCMIVVLNIIEIDLKDIGVFNE